MISLLKRTIAAAIAASAVISSVEAATLVMVDWRRCSYCQKFNREVGQEYSSSSAGLVAPLRRVNFLYKWPADLQGIRPGRGTPTFILIDNGREVGRFSGYRGKDLFWRNLNVLFARLETSTAEGTRITPTQ